jgi:hypothetical protein
MDEPVGILQINKSCWTIGYTGQSRAPEGACAT